MNRVETTVFELAGPDRAGLLAEVTHLLTHNGCNVRSAAVSQGSLDAGAPFCRKAAVQAAAGVWTACSGVRGSEALPGCRLPLCTHPSHCPPPPPTHPPTLQVWTYRGRVAFVLSVTEKGMPVVDGIKLQRLRQLVLGIMTRRPLSNSSGGLRALAAAAAAGSPGSAAAAAAAITVGSPGSSMGSPSSGMGMFTSGGVIVNIRKVGGQALGTAGRGCVRPATRLFQRR